MTAKNVDALEENLQKKFSRQHKVLQIVFVFTLFLMTVLASILVICLLDSTITT